MSYTARKDTRNLVNALNAYMKRTKGITSVRAEYFFNYVRIDVHAPKSKGKVYNEMVAYLTSIMPNYEADTVADWWKSHDDYLIDNNLIDEEETIVNVCVYHW
jgi:hypothetical protein